MHLTLFGRGKHEKTEKLYSELAPALIAYACSLGLDHSSAEDMLQSIFLHLMEGSNWPTEPRPYLFRAVRNACFNHIRNRSRDDEVADEPWFEIELVDRASELDLRRSLSRLPAEQCEVVMLHIWGGLSFQEAGTALGISPNTAASRYRYALEALKRSLNKRPKEEEQR